MIDKLHSDTYNGYEKSKIGDAVNKLIDAHNAAELPATNSQHTQGVRCSTCYGVGSIAEGLAFHDSFETCGDCKGTGRRTPLLGENLSQIINHKEAFELALLKKEISNLARCYIDLCDKLAEMLGPSHKE